MHSLKRKYPNNKINSLHNFKTFPTTLKGSQVNSPTTIFPSLAVCFSFIPVCLWNNSFLLYLPSSQIHHLSPSSILKHTCTLIIPSKFVNMSTCHGSITGSMYGAHTYIFSWFFIVNVGKHIPVPLILWENTSEATLGSSQKFVHGTRRRSWRSVSRVMNVDLSWTVGRTKNYGRVRYRMFLSSWWFQPIGKILDIRQMGSFPQVKIKNIWNHHLVLFILSNLWDGFIFERVPLSHHWRVCVQWLRVLKLCSWLSNENSILDIPRQFHYEKR